VDETEPGPSSAPGSGSRRPTHRGYLIGAIVIVAIAVAAIAAGVLLSGDDDDDGVATSQTSGAPAATAAPTDAPATTTTTTAPSPTVPGTRYEDEVFLEYRVERDIAYGSAPGADGAPVSLLLDLYEPVGDDAPARPALVWVHGGGFKNGDKAEGVPTVMSPLFAKLGYVVVSINYRLLAPASCNGANGVSPECYTAAIEGVHDGQAAVRWLRANADEYDIDVERIAIGGESAGAIIATGVGVYADQPGSSGNPDHPSDVDAWVSISGGVPQGLFVDASDAPGYLVSGTADDVVPYSWSVETANALTGVGVHNELTTLDGAGHVPVVEHGEQIQREAIAFLYEQLDLATAA
jgi:acetyl esterase/lipase